MGGVWMIGHEGSFGWGFMWMDSALEMEGVGWVILAGGNFFGIWIRDGVWGLDR